MKRLLTPPSCLPMTWTLFPKPVLCALPGLKKALRMSLKDCPPAAPPPHTMMRCAPRSEEHTSELQSHVNLVCRLLLEKKKKRSCLFLAPPKYPSTFGNPL